MNLEKCIMFYNRYKGEIAGTAIGFVFAVLVLTIGLLRTLFIILCMSIGYYIGKKAPQSRQYLKDLLDRVLPPGRIR